MHWQNTGLDIETSASTTLQVWLGAGPFSFKHNWWFQLQVLIYHQHRADEQWIPTYFANADRWWKFYRYSFNFGDVSWGWMRKKRSDRRALLQALKAEAWKCAFESWSLQGLHKATRLSWHFCTKRLKDFEEDKRSTMMFFRPQKNSVKKFTEWSVKQRKRSRMLTVQVTDGCFIGEARP